MLRDEPTEPLVERGSALTLPGAARAAQVIQAQVDAQETMNTLADQLLVLFDEIPSAGLIRQNRRIMHQHVQTYFRVADGIWEALATDQLDELTNSPGYTIVTDALESKLIQIHEDCQQADQDIKARGGWLWRRRVRLYSRALLDWKRGIDTGTTGALPDPTACGRTLYRAYGRVGLAGLNAFEYLLVTGLPLLGILASLLLSLLFGAMNVLTPTNLPQALVPTVLAGLSTLYILWFSATGSSSLPMIAGYALTHRQSLLAARTLRATINAKTTPGPLRVLLHIFLAVLGTVFMLALIALVVVTVMVARSFFLDPRPTVALDVNGYMTSFVHANVDQTLQIDPVFFMLLFPCVCLALIALFFLPFALSVQARMLRALIGQPTHSPEARRYALRPALELLSFHTITLFFIAIVANSIYNIGADSVLPSGWPFVSLRLIVYACALFVPYVLLVDLPFREGIARWRNGKLHELALRRNEIAQRLSHSQPQAADQTDLRTIQDYLTWQYYRTQESEVRDTTTAPFSIERLLLAALLAVIGGIALEQLNQLLHSLT